jgi:hypothetical protein
MGEIEVVPERRRLGRSLTWIGFLLLFVTVLVYAIHARSDGSWAPWDSAGRGGARYHATASPTQATPPPTPTDEGSAPPTDGGSGPPTDEPTATPSAGQSPSGAAPTDQLPSAPPTYPTPAEPAASSNSTAEIIKVVAYLIGAVGGVASTLLGQIMLMRGRRQESTSEPATSVRTPR